jgi:MFS family permease
MSIQRLYTGFQVSFSLLLWLPVFYEYQKRAGLPDSQIFAIQSFYYAAFCVLAIPTGIFSDRFGHRRSLVLGSLALVAANLMAVFLPTYGGFLGHFLLVGVARSLVLGASSAYLYDYLRDRGEADSYKKIEGQARASGMVIKVAAWAGTGFLMEFHATLPYWLSAGTAAVAVVFASKFPHQKGSSTATAPALDLGAMVRVLRSSPVLLIVMAQGIAIFVLDRISQVNLFQPILKDKAFGLGVFGLVSSGVAVFDALGSSRASLLRRVFKDREAILLLTVVLALSLGLIPVMGQVGTLACLAIYSMASGMAFPIQKQLMNDAIPDSRYRATLLAVEQVVDRAVCAVVAYALGGFLEYGKLDRFLVTASVVSAGFAALLFVLRATASLQIQTEPTNT